MSRFAAPFLSRMNFLDEHGEGASPTLEAVRMYREIRSSGRRTMPPDAPMNFAPKALVPLIRHDGAIDRRRWESALFLKVRDEVRAGNLAIDGAKNFGRFESFFLPQPQWQRTSEAFWARTGFPSEPNSAAQQLHALARAVYYGQRGRITAREVYDQMNACSCLTLILACIVYWQAREISRMTAAPDFPFDLELLTHVNPIEWKNVILYGEIKIDPAKLRNRDP